MRAAPTGAQWSEGQFEKMFDGGEATRMILVLEVEAGAESRPAFTEEQIPRYVRNDKLDRTGGNVTDTSGSGLVIEGFVVAHRIGSECEIENIVVSPGSQRRGFGNILLRELLNRVQQTGCRAVFLEVRESNRAARRLYEKLDFLEVGRRVNYYSQPQEDAVVYRFAENAL